MDKLFKKHFIENLLFPVPDSEQWIAYLVLKQKYSELTYWSHDGYSCDALVDYSKGLVWRDKEIVDWETKQIMATTEKSFYKTRTEDIIFTWMFFNGETTKTKRDWLNTIHETINY